MKTARFITLALLSITIALSGCSTLKSGSKDGRGADGSLSESDLDAQREARFGSGNIPMAEGEGMFRDVRFDYDSAALSDIARQNIEYNAQILRQNPSIAVTLEGHCDERGTAEYNMALGAERARAVYRVLTSLGVPQNQLEMISYGEEVPLVQGGGEDAWSQNRRVHFSAHGGGSRG